MNILNKKVYNIASLSILIYVVLMLAASISLIFVFDFPDILREPVEVMLAKFNSNSGLVVPSYYLFVLSGISFIFMTLLIHKTIVPRDSILGFLAVVSGVLFGLLSNLGFIRWPFLMKYLSGVIADPALTETGKETVKLIFNSFHTYSGVAVGENFAFWFEGFWVLFISGVIKMRKDVFPEYLSSLGFVIGAGMLVYTLEQFGGIFATLGVMNMIIHAGFLVWLCAVSILIYRFQANKNYMPVLGNTAGALLIVFYAVLLITSYA